MLNQSTPAQIESTIHDKIRAILEEQGSHYGRLSGMEKLSATLGLSSLDLAFLVAELESTLGVDPFAKLVSITSIRSVVDLVQAYQKACFPDLMSSEEDNSISTAVKRAQTRRARGKRR